MASDKVAIGASSSSSGTASREVYVKAKECNDQISAEEFAIFLASTSHPTISRAVKNYDFIYYSFSATVTAAIVNIVEKPWERVFIDGEPHKHGRFLNWSDVWRPSGFEGFIRDKYTVLPETRERMLATEVSASWRYPYASLSGIPSKPSYFAERYLDIKQSLVETFFGSPKEGVYSPSVQSTLLHMARNVLNRFPDVASIKLNMPNIHFLPVNLSSKDTQIVKFNDDVYMPTDEPHGSIEASLSRIQSKI
ncbi:unnamed protein product [Rhodiola kirilowii]